MTGGVEQGRKRLDFTLQSSSAASSTGSSSSPGDVAVVTRDADVPAAFDTMTIRTAPSYSRFRFLRRACVGAAVSLVALGLSREASAQEWLKDRKYQEGAGIRAGDFELHPGVGGEVGYDSNWFMRTHRDGFVNSNPEGGGIIRITPSFSIATLGAQRREAAQAEGAPPPPPPAIAFRGGVAATYREFIGAEELRKQRNVSGNANARLDVLPGRPIGFGVFAGYQRLIQPQSARPSNPDLSFNRSNINGGAEIIAIPGGGTLDMRAGYQIYASLFEESNGVPYSNYTHEVSFRDRWRFRPRTALFSDTTLRWMTYPNASRALNYLNDSTPLRTRFGITGLVTDRFGVLVAGGYGATFFKNPNAPSSLQFDSFIGQAEGTFYLSQNPGASEPGEATLLLSTISLGVLRDYAMSLLSNYYTTDKLYAKLVWFFGGRVLVNIEGYGEKLDYPQPFYNGGAAGPLAVTDQNGATINAFSNYRAGASFFGEYRFSDVFAINTTIKYDEMISDVAIPQGAIGGGAPPAGATANFYDLAWRRFQAFLGARLMW